MNPQIIVLLQRIRGDLRALLEKQKKEVKPVCEEEKTKQRSAEWPPSALQVKVESLEEAIEQYNTGRHTSRRLQWGTFWLTVGTFIALCVAAAFTYEQWQTMDKTYTEVQTQTVIFHNNWPVLRVQFSASSQGFGRSKERTGKCPCWLLTTAMLSREK
jgi:hypothetical protein